MNILFCGDSNVSNGLVIAILSILKNVKEELNIYVLTMDVENKEKKFKQIPNDIIISLNKILKEKNINNSIKKIDVTKEFNENIPIKNMETHFTPYSMLRLFSYKIPELPDKILYLDTDVICRQDITNLYNIDITNYEIAGVLDYYGKWFFKKNIFKFDYLNSGVLLMNLNKIRETKLFENAIKLITKKNLFMPDQSAINKLAIAKKILPRKYNEQRKLKNDTVIQHFTTSFRLFPILHTITVKPWEIEKVHSKLKLNEYDDILNDYVLFMTDLETKQ